MIKHKQDPHSSRIYSMIKDATICLFGESGKSHVQHVCSSLLEITMKQTVKQLHTANGWADGQVHPAEYAVYGTAYAICESSPGYVPL